MRIYIEREIITDWWNDAYVSIAFFNGDAHFLKLLYESHSATQLSESLAPLCLVGLSL